MHSKQILDQNSQLIKAIIVSAAILFLLVINQAKYLFTVYISPQENTFQNYISLSIQNIWSIAYGC